MKKIFLGLGALSLILSIGCAGKSKKPKTTVMKGGFERIHFAFDKSTIDPEYRPAMKKNAKIMKDQAATKLVIEGHCDERGSDEYNTALGYNRANSAKSYLESLGVSSSRIKTKSFGEDRPLKSCHAESCWSKNRRADFVAK